MKLKNKIFGTIFGVIASSFVFISVPVTANAGECSPADPCLTYAVLDNSGVVTNIIVCQPSFCGSGTLPDGTRVVPQVAANSEGQNQGGFYNHDNVPGKDVVYSEPTKTFTINNQVVATKAEVVTNTVNTETSTVSVSISEGNKNSFSYDDTVGKSFGEIELTELPLENNVSATVSASEVTSISTITESTTFEERKTAEEVDQALLQRNLNLLRSKLDRLLYLLDNWLIK